MGVLQGLCSYNGLLFAAWKGEIGDDRLFFSSFDGNSWTDQHVVAGNSSAGPATSTFRGNMVLGWKGEHSDERLFFLQVQDGLWSAQSEIHGVASSVGPSLAEFNNALYAAWKGAETDQAIWYASFDGTQWSKQATIPGVATSVGPALCTFNGSLHAVWKGWKNDQALWHASFDGAQWSAQQVIPGVASSVGPSLAIFNSKLYAAWKGVTGDESLWFSSFDGAAWAAQQVIPGVGSSTGPAISEFAGKLYAVWKGAGNDQELYYSSFDGESWAPQGHVPGNTGQDTPQNIGVRMQFQETSQWCWIAVAVSVAQFYGHSVAAQCSTMTTVGQQKNQWPIETVCCATTAIEQAHPDLLPKLLNPYDRSAENALENVGIPQVCIKSGGVSDPLKVTNNYASDQTSLTLDQIANEIAAGRPVVADIQWSSGGQHVVAIVGVLNDLLLVCDPANGESVISYGQFPAQYAGGATLVDYCLTQPG